MRNERKIANPVSHARMNEQFFLKFYMARSNIEMLRKQNRDWVLSTYKNNNSK